MDKQTVASQVGLAQALILVLADTTSLFLKTWGYHWNVTGPQFASLHKLFGDQYASLYEAVDTIAEHIRALDTPVPMDFFGVQKLEGLGSPTSAWQAMVQDLLDGHETVLAAIVDAIDAAGMVNNQGVLNLLASRQEEHDKQRWMLKALLSGK